jgi:hypothetical protein
MMSIIDDDDNKPVWPTWDVVPSSWVRDEFTLMGGWGGGVLIP